MRDRTIPGNSTLRRAKIYDVNGGYFAIILGKSVADALREWFMTDVDNVLSLVGWTDDGDRKSMDLQVKREIITGIAITPL